MSAPTRYLRGLIDRLLLPMESGEPEVQLDPIEDARRTVESHFSDQLKSIEVEEWLKHPITQEFMSKLEAEADAAHLRVAKAEITSEVYKAVFDLIVALKAFPYAMVAKGREAGAKLTELREDGTLEELDNLARGRSS